MSSQWGGEGWQEAWRMSIDLTVAALEKADLRDRCEKSGAVWRPEAGAIELTLLNRVYRVLSPGFEVVLAETGEEAPIAEKILILHYLQTAGGATLSGKWITFGEVPGGEIYLPVFNARSIDRLVRAFSGQEKALIEAAQAMGGTELDLGDVSVQIKALPRVPIALTLWRGDDEFPPSGSLLFDDSATTYLPMEDMVVLAGMLVGQVHKQ